MSTPPRATARLTRAAWPQAELRQAVAALARSAFGVGASPTTVGRPAPSLVGPVLSGVEGPELDAWLQTQAVPEGIELEAVEGMYADVPQALRGAAPALVGIELDGAPAYVLLLGCRRRHATLLTPRLGRCSVALATLVAALRAPSDREFGPRIDAMLGDIPESRRAGARAQLLLDDLSTTVGSIWLMRRAPGSSFAHQLADEGVVGRLLAMVGAQAAASGLFLASWAVIGRGGLGGQLEPAWLMAWALGLLSMVPFQMAVIALQGRLALGVGALIKRRLLDGVTRLDPDEVRQQGSGSLLGQVFESEAFESLALNGGLTAVLAIVELVLAAWVLAHGDGAGPMLAALLLWVVLAAALGVRYTQRYAAWSRERVGLTGVVVEHMVGHRTRLAQLPREDWHTQEDPALGGYLDASARTDATAIALQLLLTRGFLFAGLAALAPAFVTGAVSTRGLAVALGGLLLAGRAFGKLTQSLLHLCAAAVAWRAIGPIFRASARRGPAACVDIGGGEPAAGEPLLEARSLRYRPSGRADWVLKDCSLTLAAGDRVLLEGASGCGKSTFLSLLTGLREPDAGLLLYRGLDRRTVGAETWRRRIAAAPQFHENHILTGTLAFNLLMGSHWPPRPSDLERAEQLCRELGLGPLIDRMPGRLHQVVGETGWQLSHGECSRVFMARALLQEADVTTLDESFAALDPIGVRQALDCAFRRAGTLVVVAHPG